MYKIYERVSHTEPEIGTPFALEVMQRLNDACAKWKKKKIWTLVFMVHHLSQQLSNLQNVYRNVLVLSKV